MRKLHIMSIVMSLLSMLTVFSVGFASWVSVNPTSVGTNRTGNFESYSSSAHISIGSIKVFKFSPESFVNDSGTPIDTGVISIDYTLNTSESNEITISTSFWVENIVNDYSGLFTEVAGHKQIRAELVMNGNTVQLSGDSFTNTISDGKPTLTVEHTFTSLSKNASYEFTINYYFDIPQFTTETLTDGSTKQVYNFRKYFGQYLKTPGASGGATIFHVSAQEIKK